MIPTAGKTLLQDAQKTSVFFIAWLVLCILMFSQNFIDHIHTLNLISAGISCFLLIYFLRRNLEMNFIFMILLLFNSAYVALRQYLFAGFIENQFNQSITQIMDIVANRYSESSEQYMIFSELMDVSTHFYLSYSPGMWIALMMLCILVGYFITFRQSEDYVPISQYQVHLYVCYVAVLALGICILPGFRLIGINLLLAIMPLFLIQGMAVAHHKMVSWFSHSLLLKIIAIICIIINPYIVLFLSIIGLFDNWLDFRKLYNVESTDSQENTGGEE